MADTARWGSATLVDEQLERRPVERMVDHSVHMVVDQQRVCRHQKNSKYSRISQSVTSPRKRLHSLAFIWHMNRTNPSPNASLKKSSASSSATASHRLVGSFGASAA